MAGLTSTTVGSITYQQAPVSGGGQLNIFDGVNTLTGNVSWNQIHLVSNGQGGISDSLSVNLTGIAYTGANADLLALASQPNNGNLNLTFQFSGTDPTLTGLFAGTGTQSVSYSGSISSAASTAVPEPSTVVAGALLLLPFGVSTLRILRKHKQNHG
jgi:hypothetical protein